MPTDRDEPRLRRGLVPASAARSLWLTAAWTGTGAALVGAVVSIVTVAICWLPASGTSGNASSAVHAGLLTFLAALHGGITVGGLSTAFVPLGMTLLAGLIAWRAGTGLADAAGDLDETDPARLIGAGVLQAGAFAITCAVGAAVATLGTSSVPVAGAGFAGLVLFALAGGAGLVRSSVLAEHLAARVPAWTPSVTRIAAAVTAVYAAAGAVLVAGAVVVHHARVEALSHEVGGGWSGVPILLLGILAAPNAVIAGSAYLSGAGFAVGGATTVGLTSTAHGTVPAFPVLGALPTGHGATVPVWLLAVTAPVVAGWCVVVLSRRADTWEQRWTDAGLGILAAALVGAVLAWQGGGAIGDGALRAVGASPWQFGLAVTVGAGLPAAVVLGALHVIDATRLVRRDGVVGSAGEDRDLDAEDTADLRPLAGLRSVWSTLASTGAAGADEPDDPAEGGKRAG